MLENPNVAPSPLERDFSAPIGTPPVEANLADLNDAQREAVVYGDGPLLVVAGAGSGKTRVLTHRIAHLVQQRGVPPWRILAITFTNKAANEMRERVAQMSGPDADKMWVMTFHSACGRILRRDAERLGYASNFTIYDQGDQLRLVKRCIEMLDLDPKRVTPAAVHNQISSAKNRLVSPDAYREQASSFLQETVADVYERYNTALMTSNAMDFDDMLMRTVELLERHPDVCERWQQSFHHVLVDEYQDTNHAQYRFLKLIAEKHQNVCCVGDEDQSIYSWRGADIRNIQAFHEDFPGAHTVVLDQNYRSTQFILDAANAVIANNVGRTPKHLWSELGTGSKVRVVEVEDEHAEARLVVSRIAQEIQDNGRSARDIAVFYRTNAQSRVLEDALTRHGLGYQVIGGPRFYERAEVKDAIAYLRCIDNPADAISLQRIVNTPKRGIGPTTVDKLALYAATYDTTLWEAMRNAPTVTGVSAGAAKKIGEFVAMMNVLHEVKSQTSSVSLLLEAVYDRSGLIDVLNMEQSIEAQGRIENLQELIGVAQEYDQRATVPDLGEFLQSVSLQSDADGIAEEGGMVTLMTIHNAKGLEYPVVFVTGLEEGLFPHSRSLDDEIALEEERRLCYVGITRAREQLTLVYAACRTVFGRKSYNMSSRFIDELPEETVERSGKKSAAWQASAGWTGSSGRATYGGGRPLTSSYSSPGIAKREESEIPSLAVGDNVRHASFGEGVVIDIERGELVVVRFAGDGEERRLMLAYAPLEVINQ
jgi:DNA helicase-2/ATP-dependent DNA helicase PcrA